MLDNKSIYFPAVSVGSFLNTLKDNQLHPLANQSFRFYNKNENPIFYYPNILISAGHNFKKDSATDLNYNVADTCVLGDSGGFQIATGVLDRKVDEVRGDIFNWLENNSTYALNIDTPLYDIDSVNDPRFNERIKMTVENFTYFYTHKKHQTKFLNVLQGKNEKLLEAWYSQIKEFDFEGGWAIGGVRDHIYLILQSFFFLWYKGEIEKYNNKNALIHILGFSKLSSLHYILYLQKKLNLLGYDIKISFDSSYPFITAGYGHYFVFNKKTGMTNMSMSNTIIKNKEHINLETELPCSCPICKNVTFKDIWKGSSDTGFASEAYSIIGVHNFYKFLDHKKHMENILNTECISIYKSIFNENDFKVFNFIDRAFEADNSFEYVVNNKIQLVKLLEEQDLVKKSLF